MLPKDKTPETDQIFAAQKIIADISSGLYRSPAAALKELVANAYDADADTVTITTSPPDFTTLVVRDNGTGMSLEKFLDVMRHIGGSKKRIINGEYTSEKGRRIIGRIGVGLLAVAQLGFRFYVSSSVKGSPTRFIAEIDLEPFHRQDAALVSMGKLNEDSGEVEIGRISYVRDLSEDTNVQYTIITVPDVKQGIISEMTGTIRQVMGATEELSISRTEIRKFDQLIELLRSTRRADIALDGYYYMLWELALLCPINYSGNGPFEAKNIEIDNVESLLIPHIKDFKVVVDGIELRRPQLFPSKCAWTENFSGLVPFVIPIHFNRQIAGRLLKFDGYIYVQRPRIDPEEFKGVHIRIKNVGVGTYDKSWLGYPFDEGVKFGQVTGEIYVEEGLEEALNIDRDSFMETHVHYQTMRAHLWDTLRKKVFPEYQSRASKNRNQRKVEEQGKQLEEFRSVLYDLPSPHIVEKVDYLGKIENPILSTWIGINDQSIELERDKWRAFADSAKLTEQEKNRFIRVLTVLISSELLTNVPDAEVEILLQALVHAIK